MSQKVSKEERRIVPIGPVKLTSTRYSQVLKLSLGWAKQKKQKKGKFLATVNPEIVNQAWQDPAFAEIINGADLALPDGVGLVWARRFLSGESSEVIPGRLLFEGLVRQAARRRLRVFFLGGKPGIAAAAARRLAISYQLSANSLQFEAGPWLDKDGRPVNQREQKVEQTVIKKINQFQPHFLFVGFGAPKQELWLAHHLPKLKVRVAMTVGGTFDYFAGQVPFPPAWMEKRGLEWFWRLLTQPWRAPRITRAVIIFPLRLLWYRLSH